LRVSPGLSSKIVRIRVIGAMNKEGNAMDVDAHDETKCAELIAIQKKLQQHEDALNYIAEELSRSGTQADEIWRLAGIPRKSK